MSCTNQLPLRTPEGDMDANTVAINFVWTLVAGFLVMFMQAGFALVETGFTRAKNAAHTMTMNFMVYGIAMLAYWAVGFALQAGGVGPVRGDRVLPHGRRLHGTGVRLLPVPDGLHGHHGHDPDRSAGRTVEVL